MKKCLIALFLLPSFLSCANKTCYVTINASNCVIEGLESSYKSGTRVNAKVTVNDLIYSLPIAKMLQANGVSSLKYDEKTGDLSFVVEDDVNISAIAESFYGPETTYTAVLQNYEHNSPENTVYDAWEKAKFNWDFSSVTNPDDQSILFDKLKIYGLETDQLSGELTLTQVIDEDSKIIPIFSFNDFFVSFPYYKENRYFDAVRYPPSFPCFYIYQTQFPLFLDQGSTDAILTFSVTEDTSRKYCSNIKSNLIDYDIGGSAPISGSFAVEYKLANNYES